MLKKGKKIKNNLSCSSGGGAVYGLGFVGALIYFIQHAQGLGEGILGVAKAIVWPAMVVYKVLEVLKF